MRALAAATISLTAENKASRTAYAKEANIQASTSGRIMIWSGITILVFVIYHLLHFTAHAGNTYEDYKDALGRKDREGNSYISYFFQPRR